jgi:hypothetical protein
MAPALKTEATRNDYFDRLAPVIADKLSIDEIDEEILPIRQSYPIPLHGLLYRISRVLSQRQDFVGAQKLADTIIINEEGSEEIDDSAHETRAQIYVDCKEWALAREEANLIKNSSKKDALLEKVFNACLIEDDPRARETIADFVDEAKRETIRECFVNTAIKKGEFQEAFEEVIKMGSPEARKKFIIPLMPEIIKDVESFVEILKFFNKSFDTLLDEIIAILFEAGHVDAALSMADFITDETKRTNFFEKTYDLLFKKGDLSNAYQAMRSLSPERGDSLSLSFVQAAIDKNGLVLAAQKTRVVEDESLKKQCYDLVVPKIAEHPLEFIQSESFAGDNRDDDELLIRVIPLLIDKGEFDSADAVAKKLTFGLNNTWLDKIKQAKPPV